MDQPKQVKRRGETERQAGLEERGGGQVLGNDARGLTRGFWAEVVAAERGYFRSSLSGILNRK